MVGVKRSSLTFIYEVEAIEVALIFNAYAWMRYFSLDPAIMHTVQFYQGLLKVTPASTWYTGALVLMVVQTIAFVSRSYFVRSVVFLMEIAAGIFAQIALTHINVITMNKYQNFGLLIAVIYGLIRLSIRRATIRIHQ